MSTLPAHDAVTAPPLPPRAAGGAAPEPTVAAFSPDQQTATRSRNRASVLIHEKSALLAATPPAVTRALAYSHPFIVPLNCLAGLLSWTTGDPWESFLLVTCYWFAMLYGDLVMRYAAPLVVAAALIAGMYSRRYSPLSSTTWSADAKRRLRSDSDSQQRKSLDEILDTLQIFTNRCDVLLDPLLRLTEFLSTQTSATSATTRPALTSMFVRLLAVMPFWVALALPPLHVITTQRFLLVFGTVAMTWHSRPARATRTILWRSRTLRGLAELVTGLKFSPSPLKPTGTEPDGPPLPPRAPPALVAALRRQGSKSGVRFTFSLYENQRRWLLLGFTSNLLPHERSPWTDEQNLAVPAKDDFPLPETDADSATRWRWVSGSQWALDPKWTDSAAAEAKASPGDREGWTYSDNKWHHPSRIDDWGKWTRRRRWIRDAELIPDVAVPLPTSTPRDPDQEQNSVSATVRRKGWFARRSTNDDSRSADVASTTGSGSSHSRLSRDGGATADDEEEDNAHTPLLFAYRETQFWDRSIGDGLAEGLS